MSTNKPRIQAKEKKKILELHMSDKWLISRIHEELKKLKNKSTH